MKATSFLLLALAALAALAAAGCASIDSSEDTDGTRTGIRYYNSAPFILAYSDGKGGVTSEIVYLPDTTRVMSLDATAFFAQNKSVMSFERSVLTTSKTSANAAEVPKAIIEAAKSIAVAQQVGSGNVPDVNTRNLILAPYLFRIHYDPTTKKWELVGGEAKSRVKSTFVREVE